MARASPIGGSSRLQCLPNVRCAGCRRPCAWLVEKSTARSCSSQIHRWHGPAGRRNLEHNEKSRRRHCSLRYVRRGSYADSMRLAARVSTAALAVLASRGECGSLRVRSERQPGALAGAQLSGAQAGAGIGCMARRLSTDCGDPGIGGGVGTKQFRIGVPGMSAGLWGNAGAARAEVPESDGTGVQGRFTHGSEGGVQSREEREREEPALHDAGVARSVGAPVR